MGGSYHFFCSPQITNLVRLAAEKILHKEVMVLGPGLKTGLNIQMDQPGQLGASLVADAVTRRFQYQVPLIIFDMGTATTVSLVDGRKHYIGDEFSPGIPDFSGCADGKSFAVRRHQHRSPKTCDWKKYG